MHAAALFAATPKSAGAHAAGALALDPAKPEDPVTSDAANAFTQALAGLMGVTAGPTAPAIQPTTSDAGQASGAKRGAIVSGPSFASISQAGPAAAPATPAEALVEAESPSQAIPPPTVTPAPAVTGPTVTVQTTTVQTIAVQTVPVPTATSQTTPALAAAPVTTPLAAAPDEVAVPAPAPAQTPQGSTRRSDVQIAAAPTPEAPAVEATTVPTPDAAPPADTPVPEDQVAAASSQPPPATAATPLAFSALSFSVKLTGAATTPTPATADPVDAAAAQATAPQATAPEGAPPELQPLSPLSGGAALVSTPIASLTLTADEAAAALPTQTLAPVKATVATPPAKASTKPDAASAPAAADADPTAAADQPASANAAQASLPAVADAADRSAKSASDGPAPVAETQSTSNGADSTSALVTVAAPQTSVQASANLAAANGSAIVSQIAAQVAKSVDGKSTRFDIALDPAGLGHVDVKVEIGAQGQVTAQLSFDNAHAAAAAKSQAGQLQQALEQAGFNISQGGLSFDVGGQGAGFARQDAPAPQPTAAAVQTPDITDASLAAVAAINSPRPLSGVDITI